jgi:hypothetical protein
MATTVNRKAALAATTPAEFARAIGHEDGGKRVRAKLRSTGIRVSKGHKFDAKAKQMLLAAFVDGKKEAAKKASKKSSKAKAKVEATPAE